MLKPILRGAIFALTALAPALAHAQAPAKPHILYIVADDLGRADLGFQGAEFKTPTLDQLANEGAVLDQFYVQPMCTPTRAALMTGRYPIRYGMQSFVILPEQTYGIPLDGMNVWKTISEGAASPRNEIVYNVEMFRAAVRQGDWKLVTRFTLPSKAALFNLAQIGLAPGPIFRQAGMVRS
jgi:arylsulfatase A-like enzyme